MDKIRYGVIGLGWFGEKHWCAAEKQIMTHPKLVKPETFRRLRQRHIFGNRQIIIQPQAKFHTTCLPVYLFTYLRVSLSTYYLQQVSSLPHSLNAHPSTLTSHSPPPHPPQSRPNIAVQPVCPRPVYLRGESR